MTASGWRDDIQALRGWAVLFVVLFHTGLGIAPSGFVGVDIFFVVSGYLITGNVVRERNAGTLRIGRFYQRRIRRLWPAAFVTLLATTLAAALLLTPTAQARFWQQLVGALTFSTNVALWRQINYFHDSAALEPLLHFWSLAVEEQYYLLLPVTLLLVPHRWWPAMVAAVTLASLAAFLWLYPWSPGAAFYLLPTRAWELGIGSLVACMPVRGRVQRLAYRTAPGLAAIVLTVPFMALPTAAAYWLTLPACAATAGLLAAARPIGPRGAVAGWLGDRSYAIYLVHWPPIAFAHAIWLGNSPPAWVAILLCTAGIGVGAVLHGLVERPCLRLPLSRWWWAALIAGSAIIAVTGALAPRLTGNAIARVDLQPVTGLPGAACDGSRTTFDPACRTGPAPRLLLWGDSFSQHLVPGLQATTDVAFAQASKGGCPPLPGLAPVDMQASVAVARGCIAFGDSVLSWLAHTPSVEVVMLSGSYLRYTWPGVRVLRRDGSLKPPNADQLAAAQRDMVARVRRMGKRVVLVAAPPQSAFDVGQCQERRVHHLLLAGAPTDCAITPANRLAGSDWLAALMARFARDGTPVVQLAPGLCRSDGICPTAWAGRPLWVEGKHLTRTGSIVVARRLGLGAHAWELAR
ncbi:acyltransferase family protein [Sphingomonas sp. OK281]|uniref:acyltransferase family protein n=1 Tax=Sphingomonas sp. OK281 TaxID=1881067 RepID=UPI0008F113F0|nr:acyltransferase family protein [Sphingomonas sp. OK281]SFO48616.1 Peptidoglycan/LPS O-acetylase OafA/YrhL, contains acyltransferase and SGNH-hydrolase domains [Sphingomonas sp. OK281]